MSNITNTKLLEEAYELQEYFASNLWDRVLQRDIDAGDLEALYYHVREARAERYMEEHADLVEANDAV